MTNEQIIRKLKDDMKMRGFSHWTEQSYLSKTKEIMKYFKKPMEEVKIEELREFLLKYLREERKLAERSVNYYNSIIRFMYEVTMDKIINKKQLPMYKRRRKMKEVLTKEELSTFFNACDNYMYKTIFMMIYGSGLRISEAVNLKIEDIDSKKMRIYVRAGKGGKDRYTVLSKTSLEMLRKYYKMYKPKHPNGYMFVNREGKQLTTERTRVFFRRYRRKAKIEENKEENGSKTDNYSQVVDSNLPKSFKLNIPLFKGFTCEEIEVEIYADVDGREVSLSLVSAGANETIEEYKNKVIDEQIEAIKGIAPDIVIIEV